MLHGGTFFKKQSTSDINAIPKVELHVHLEGTITPALIRKFSLEYKIPIPSGLIDPDSGDITFKNFEDFIKKYDDATSLICCTEAITLITYEYLKQSAKNNVIYSELTVSPDHMAKHDISYQDTIAAVIQGIQQAKKEFNIDARILIVLVRHLGEQHCEAVVDTILSNPNEYVVGISLAGNEEAFPPSLFENAFKKAKKGNLKLSAHAGEITNAKDVSNAINFLNVDRIGHGIHAAFDEKITNEIVGKKIHLEICPTSNHVLKTHENYPEEYKYLAPPQHPLSILHQKGVRYSLNSDDPPFFNNATLLTEYSYAAKLLALEPIDLIKITIIAIEDSFAPESLKKELLKKVGDFSAKHFLLDSKNNNENILQKSLTM